MIRLFHYVLSGSSRLGVMIAIVLSTTAFLMLSLFAAYAAYARLSKMKEGTVLKTIAISVSNY